MATWTITWEEFLLYVSQFMAISDELHDGWTWQGNKEIPGGAFVMKKIIHKVSSSHRIQEKEEEYLEDNTLQNEVNDSCDISEEGLECCTSEFHVLFSTSYGTPVLYFNVFNSCGQLLTLERLWQGWPGDSGGTREALKDQQWEALSQHEHPILRRPYFQLHPCKTAELLGLHQGSSNNPVVTWLSSIGPAVGLCLHERYGCLVS